MSSDTSTADSELELCPDSCFVLWDIRIQTVGKQDSLWRPANARQPGLRSHHPVCGSLDG